MHYITTKVVFLTTARCRWRVPKREREGKLENKWRVFICSDRWYSRRRLCREILTRHSQQEDDYFGAYKVSPVVWLYGESHIYSG